MCPAEREDDEPAAPVIGITSYVERATRGAWVDVAA